MTQTPQESCGSSDVTTLQLTDHPDFTVEVAESTDALFLNEVVGSGVPMWKVGQSITLIAVYRMKQLFETYDTRRAAVESTGYSSWTDWLTSHDWPVAIGTLRTRVLDIENYRRTGVGWDTVQGILASSPTAGHEVYQTIATRDGNLLPHIREEDLPGGSLSGLLEALAEAPTPGQGRTLVSETAGNPRIFVDRMIHTSTVMYANVVYEQPGTTTVLYMSMYTRNEDGEPVHIPPAIAEWLADRLGIQLEMLER